MASTYTPIATTTLGSASNSITFSSIPSTYTDLVLIVNSTGFSASGNAAAIRANGDTGSNYSSNTMWGNGSTSGSTRYYSLTGIVTGGTVNGTGTGTGMFIVNVFNYANTSTYKTIMSRGSLASQQTDASCGTWLNTNAINSLTFYIYDGGTTMSSGTTATLYGVKAA